MYLRNNGKTVLMICSLCLLIACSSEDNQNEAPPPNVVDVVARDFAFEAPDSISSGWTTVRMENAGEQHHFVNLFLLPEGKNFDDYLAEVAPPFEDALNAVQSGELTKDEAVAQLIEDLPDWIFPFGFRGGPGLTAPGMTAQATVDLEPGNYVMECYVKTPEGEFHSSRGMVRPLTVTADSTGAVPPEGDLSMTLADNSITVEGELTPGTHTFEVSFGSHPEGTFPNDVHLARMEGDVELETAAAWMDWRDALQAPSPVTFVGGIQNRPAGDTGYFTVDLEPGEYAWIAEEHGPAGMVQRFTVDEVQ